MAKDWEAEGKKQQLGGKFQELKGALTGDSGDKLKGKLRQAAGGLQENLGQAGHKAEREARQDR